MDKVNQAVALAERVVHLRTELRAAEGELVALMDGGRPAPVQRPAPSGAPVSQKVRDLLKDGRKALTFGEIVQLAGGRQTHQAVRAALKKERARKQVRFAGGKYSWTGK